MMVPILIFTCSCLLVTVACNPVDNGPTVSSGVQYIPPNSRNDNPVFNMFRNFASSFPPYANPMNYIPPQAFHGGYPGAYGPGYNPYVMANNPFMGQAFNPAFGYGGGGAAGTPTQSVNGMGYAGPFVGSGYGQPDPAYANVGNRDQPGNVPILNTRLAGNGNSGTGTSVVKTDDGQYAHVSVQQSPDGKPIYRSQTIQGPNSYGTAFAYSSG